MLRDRRRDGFARHVGVVGLKRSHRLNIGSQRGLLTNPRSSVPSNDGVTPPHAPIGPAASSLPVPSYLQEIYWWAYVHPWAVRVFEREWLVNLILLGNYARLRDAALAE